MVHKKIGSFVSPHPFDTKLLRNFTQGERAKEIGSFLTRFIFFITFLFSYPVQGANKQTLALSFLDNHNHACREAMVGERYRVEARLCNTDATGKIWPQIEGLSTDWIVGRHQRQEVSWVQGEKTEAIYFVWEVVFNRAGVLNIGPARYTDSKGIVVESLPLSITVGEQQNMSSSSQGVSTAVSTFMRWEVDRLDPFVGEVVPINLVFYTTDASLELESISEIQCEKGQLEISREPLWSSSVHNGRSYKTVTWSGILVPCVPGELPMPVVTIAYREGSRSQSSSPWAMMHHMLSAFAPVHQKRSSALSLNVRSLPATSHACIGVGAITSITHETANSELRKGEAGALTYHLQGAIHPSVLKLPLPEVQGAYAKVYASSCKTQGSYPHYTYEQEYVIHPQAEGVLNFEEQKLWFFNPKKEVYESYTIPAFEISVIENPALPAHQEVDEQVDEDKKDNNELPVKQPLPNKEKTKTTMPLKPWLPLSWFLFFLLAPCVFFVIKGPLSRVSAYLYGKLKLVWITKTTLRKVNYAVQRGDGYGLLQAMRYFMEIDCGIKTEHAETWNGLWDDLQKAAFGDKLSAQEYVLLGDRCRMWINMAYRFCKNKRGI